jgi:cytochrome oxidase Cu insertion factor (SCO1/SenC/PrrC family)
VSAIHQLAGGRRAGFAASVALLGLLQGKEDVMPFDPGPAVGERLPAFEAVDQDGRPRTFESLRGPKGLVLLFFRSADW